MNAYRSDQTLRDARAQYFALNNFGWGGYDDKWVKVEYGLLRVYFPNTRGRVKVVKYHDLHHVLTEYSTSLSGETEIGAWEIATGCTRSLAAWILNLSAFAWGLVINPRNVYKAFIRGRQSGNLYDRPLDEKLLSSSVGAVREQLKLDGPVRPASRTDNAAFIFWAMISVISLLGIISLVVMPFIFVLSAVWWLIR